MYPISSDANLTCIAIPVSGVNQDDAFFEAYLEVDPLRRKWKPKTFWGREQKDYKILVLCCNSDILTNVNALTEISPEKIDLRKQQAADAGFNFHVLPIENTFTMIYYHH